MDTKKLNDEGRELWHNKAEFWDELHGDEGNLFHRILISPSVERLLNLQEGERVLDMGCGNGTLARRLAELGGKVVAFDFSAELIKLAKSRSQPSGDLIDYHVIDATDEEAMVALGDGQFDAITCTMTIMDVPTVVPMFQAVARLLADGGRFVFASAHPAFNSNNPIFVHEMIDTDGEVAHHYAVKMRTYLDMPPVKGGGAPNEPNPHYYYHRPLHKLLGSAFEAGLVLDGIEEPAFAPEDAQINDRLSWHKLSQIPPVMAGRFRLK